MRSQSKRFVVEVKRGTSRAAFTSPDSSTAKFSSAEQALFGNPTALDGQDGPAEAAPTKPQGRVLPSLIEPPPPVVEMPEPPRRGRKPGSKNKPKAAMPTAPAVSPSLEDLSPEARAFAEPAPARHRAAERFEDAGVAAPADQVPAPARERTRLRDRSSILKRYVLGTEPGPGQPGRLRARRAARAAR